MEYLTEETSKGPIVKGKGFEVVCGCLLRQWSSYTVFSFVKEIFGLAATSSLPGWTQKATLMIDEAGTAQELGFDNDYDAIGSMFSANTAYFLRPDDRMRPDWLSWSPIERGSKTYWGLICSTKLLSSKLHHAGSRNDFFSTDPNKFYYLADGTAVNPKAQKLWKECQMLMDEQKTRHNIEFIGNLRIHIVLPNATQTGIVIENNDVVAFIDIQKFGKFCRENLEVVELVQKLCCEEKQKE